MPPKPQIQQQDMAVVQAINNMKRLWEVQKKIIQSFEDKLTPKLHGTALSNGVIALKKTLTDCEQDIKNHGVNFHNVTHQSGVNGELQKITTLFTDPGSAYVQSRDRITEIFTHPDFEAIALAMAVEPVASSTPLDVSLVEAKPEKPLSKYQKLRQEAETLQVTIEREEVGTQDFEKRMDEIRGGIKSLNGRIEELSEAITAKLRHQRSAKSKAEKLNDSTVENDKEQTFTIEQRDDLQRQWKELENQVAERYERFSEFNDRLEKVREEIALLEKTYADSKAAYEASIGHHAQVTYLAEGISKIAKDTVATADVLRASHNLKVAAVKNKYTQINQDAYAEAGRDPKAIANLMKVVLPKIKAASDAEYAQLTQEFQDQMAKIDSDFDQQISELHGKVGVDPDIEASKANVAALLNALNASEEDMGFEFTVNDDITLDEALPGIEDASAIISEDAVEISGDEASYD